MKIIYSSMLPLLAAVCVWTSGCGSLESAVESSTTTATTATETTTETTETTVAETTTTSATETTTTSATETTTASATEIATEIAAIPTTEATDDAAAIEVFACTAGTWYMDGEGGVAAYYATGNLEYSGYLECTDATSGTYAIYQDSGEYVTDFTFDDADTFHINSNWGPVTFRRT